MQGTKIYATNLCGSSMGWTHLGVVMDLFLRTIFIGNFHVWMGGWEATADGLDHFINDPLWSFR